MRFLRWRTDQPIQQRARELRCESTQAEESLWDALRGRRLDGLKFRRQHPIGRYIADFCCVERRLIIELDGGIHLTQQEQDAERTVELERLGYLVMRYSNERIDQELGAVLAELRALLNDRRNDADLPETER